MVEWADGKRALSPESRMTTAKWGGGSGAGKLAFSNQNIRIGSSKNDQ